MGLAADIAARPARPGPARLRDWEAEAMTDPTMASAALPGVEAEALEVTHPQPGVALVRIVSEPLGVQRTGVRRALRARLADFEATPTSAAWS